VDQVGRDGELLVLEKMAWPEVEAAARTVGIVVLPIGSTEQHGPHLPLDTDSATAAYLARQGAGAAGRALGRPAAVVAPTIPFGGPGLAMSEWPGTIALRPQVFIELFKDVAGCLARAGFRFIVTVNGCAGNTPALNLAAQAARAEHPQTEFLVVDGLWRDREAVAAARASALGGTGHACEIETSVALVIDPEHVHMERAVDEIPRLPSTRLSYDFAADNPYVWPARFRSLTESGVMGRATLATADKGRTVLAAAQARLAAILVELAERAPEEPFR